MSWLSGWAYRRAITITEQSGSTLTDFQVRIELNSSNFDFSKANVDGSDIRFTADDGETLLSYYIEKWDDVNEEAVIWVKVPSIPANGETTIYLYYGNPSAVSESDGEAVFEFFDDFDTDTIGEKWQVLETTSGCIQQISDSQLWLEVPGGGWQWSSVVSTQSFPANAIVVEAYVLRNSDAQYMHFPGISPDNTTANTDDLQDILGIVGNGPAIDYDSLGIKVGGEKYSFPFPSKVAGTWTKVKLMKNGNLVRAVIDAFGYDTGWIDPGITIPWTDVYIRFTVWDDDKLGGLYVDYVFVRKYADQEPTVVVGEEEESDVPGWLYRRKITIHNPNDYDLEHFQVAIDLDGSNFDFIKANADGSDIRVAYASPRYSLPYYIETWDTSTPQAVIWVGIDSETRFFVELDPNNTTDESDPTVMDLPEATNYTLAKFERYTGGG